MRRILLSIIIIVATGTCYAQKHGGHGKSTKTASCFLGTDRPSGCVEKKLRQEFDSSIIYNDAILKGYWFKPHDAVGENIYFHKGNLFEMFVYQTVHGDVESIYKTGTYKLEGDSIYLKSSDGWRLSLRWWRPWPKDKNKYITKGKRSNFKIYLVKGS